MAETVFAMVQRQEQERREAIARGEPDPFLIKEPEEPASEPNRLERFEEWMATDWEFGPYYWEEGQERPESLKERCRQRFWWLYEKNLRGAEFVGEVVANLFGLTESKYQWVIDAQRDEERREKQRKLEDATAHARGAGFAEREATEQAAARRAEGDVEHRATRRRRGADAVGAIRLPVMRPRALCAARVASGRRRRRGVLADGWFTGTLGVDTARGDTPISILRLV